MCRHLPGALPSCDIYEKCTYVKYEKRTNIFGVIFAYKKINITITLQVQNIDLNLDMDHGKAKKASPRAWPDPCGELRSWTKISALTSTLSFQFEYKTPPGGR